MSNVVDEVPQWVRERITKAFIGSTTWDYFRLYRHGDEWWCNIHDKTKQPGDEGRFMRLKVPAGETDQLIAMIGILL